MYLDHKLWAKFKTDTVISLHFTVLLECAVLQAQSFCGIFIHSPFQSSKPYYSALFGEFKMDQLMLLSIAFSVSNLNPKELLSV